MSWSPPSLGVPTGYSVRIDSAELGFVTSLETRTTRIRIPPGILVDPSGIPPRGGIGDGSPSTDIVHDTCDGPGDVDVTDAGLVAQPCP